MLAHEILEKLTARFPDVAFALHGELPSDPSITVPAPALASVAAFLKSEPGLAFDFLRCACGVDMKDRLDAVYHLYSMKVGHSIVIKVALPRDNPVVDSVSGLWDSANWFEREAFDLLGIRFAGHPDLRRIMLPPDWEGHPLRKDYKEKSDYHGIPTDRLDPVKV